MKIFIRFWTMLITYLADSGALPMHCQGKPGSLQTRNVAEKNFSSRLYDPKGPLEMGQDENFAFSRPDYRIKSYRNDMSNAFIYTIWLTAYPNMHSEKF